MEELSRHPTDIAGHPAPRDSLIDVLDRVLDKGVVIAGDIRINLLDIELLTIKIRLLIASADKAKEMGIDWWAHDPQLSSKADLDKQRLDAEEENRALRERVERLESQLTSLALNAKDGGAPRRGASHPGQNGGNRRA
jgi:hypothetical protein